MKIVFVGTLLPHAGGSAVLSTSLLTGLAGRGHDITALAPLQQSDGGRPDPLADAPFAVERYFVERSEVSPDQPSTRVPAQIEGEAITERAQALLTKARPDIVMAGRETFALQLGPLMSRHRLPWILLAQGGGTWGLLRGTMPEPVRQPLREAMAQADCIVAVARHLADRLRQLGFERVAAVPNAVDTERFAATSYDAALASSLGISRESIVIAHVSNLKDLKRPMDIVHSAAIALRRDPRLLYLVVGDGPKRAAMEAECQRLGLLDHFRFAGWVRPPETARHIRLADIVLMPSTVEALALAYLETQACGRVLIASDVDGAREVIADGDSGLLFPVGDVNAMAELTLRAAADPELRARIGSRARQSVAQRPLSVMIEEYEAVLSAVVASSYHRR